MPDLSKTTAITTPTSGTTDSYALPDYELASMVNDGGTVSKRANLFQAISGENLAAYVLGMVTKPTTDASYAPQEYDSLGAVTGTIVNNGTCSLWSAYVTSATTAIRYFQIFNQSTAPVLGQTPVNSYPLGSVPAGGVYELNLTSSHFSPSRYMGTGLAWAISSTQGTLGTASVTAADYSVKLKYTI